MTAAQASMGRPAVPHLLPSQAKDEGSEDEDVPMEDI